MVILKALLRWWWLIVMAVALAAGVGYYIRSRQVDLYYSQVTVLIGRDVRNTADSYGIYVNEDLLNVYSELARREVVLNPVAEELNLGIPGSALMGQLVLSTLPDVSLLQIGVVDTDADRAALIANAIAAELIRQSPSERVSDQEAFIRQQLNDIQNQIVELQQEHETLLAEANTIVSALDLNQNLTQRETVLGNIRELQRIYAELSQSLGDPSNQLTIFEPAIPNYSPIATNSMIGVLLSAAGGAVLAVITIVLITFFDDRLEWEESGSQQIEGVEVLGPLGVIPKSKLPLYVDTMQGEIESEVLRQLRAKIVLANGGVQPKVVSFTSYDSGDGKTVTTSNVALAYALSGLRTIVVDGDMRKGDLHEVFRRPNIMGLSDVLASRSPLESILSQALLQSDYENLTILPAGRSNADPAALLAANRFKQLLDLLKRQFDVVVLDTVPTVGGSDAAFIGEASDGVVIVIHARRTTRTALRRTIENLRQASNVTIFGIAFNRVRLRITAGYSKPYYRRAPVISPERLQREMQAQSGKRRLLPQLQRHVLTTKEGERLYSLEACATHLGVNKSTIEGWIKTGYMKAERRGNRQWVREPEITALLSRLPHQSITVPSNEPMPSMTETNGTSNLPALLREQREALLDYMLPENASKNQDND
jgi:polysaccharide biosynthesis transport protein